MENIKNGDYEATSGSNKISENLLQETTLKSIQNNFSKIRTVLVLLNVKQL